MNKKLTISILILILFSIVAYGQKITFEKNINYKANILLQGLNKAGDSLILDCKNKEIRQVDIFNDDFSERIDVYNNKTKIDLKKLPIGNFVVQAIVDKKLIVMYLKKHEDIIVSNSNQEPIDKTTKLKSNKASKKEKVLYYWVVSESNSNFGSSKSMKLEYKENVAKLISKNKLELKSNIGKDNKLIVYAVYNKSKFMNKQFRNPKYYKSAEESKFFNAEPFYVSDNSKKNNTSTP